MGSSQSTFLHHRQLESVAGDHLYKSPVEEAGGGVTYCSLTSALRGQMIRHLRSRRAQWPERESTPKTTSRRAGISDSLEFRNSLEVKPSRAAVPSGRRREELDLLPQLLFCSGSVETDLLLPSRCTRRHVQVLVAVVVFRFQLFSTSTVLRQHFPIVVPSRLQSICNWTSGD